MNKLVIELVPRTSWKANLRKELPKEEWDKLRKECYKKAGYLCEICGGKGLDHPVECHEIWSYSATNRVQKLEGLIALCPSCHLVKHMGFARVSGKEEEAVSHLRKVNSWDVLEADRHIVEAFRVWRERSKHDWTLDLSWLNTVENKS